MTEIKLLDFGYAIGKLRKTKEIGIDLLIVTPGNYEKDYPPEPAQSVYIVGNKCLADLADAINYFLEMELTP